MHIKSHIYILPHICTWFITPNKQIKPFHNTWRELICVPPWFHESHTPEDFIKLKNQCSFFFFYRFLLYMYPQYMLSVKRPKLVFHLVVWGERERESELVSVRERVSVFSLCGSPPLTLLQRFTSLSSCNLHPVVSIEPLCCSPPIPLVHSFILHCPCIPIKSRLSLDFLLYWLSSPKQDWPGKSAQMTHN